LPSGTDLSGVNASYASGVNLRGLGSDATLVLVNGRRLAGSGAKADFADLSTIPTAAVDRVEVLLDGGSAIYGSDAVGGVVNIILKSDFEGTETRLRAGGVADGPAGEYGFGQTVGGRWTSGSGLISYEYLDREALPASERPRAGNADLRPYGGTDRRTYYSAPGNIVGYDPEFGGYASLFAIPATDAPLAPGDFRPGETNLDNHLAGTNVLGRQTRHSVFAAMNQAIGAVTVSGDLRYGRRDFDTRSGAPTAILTVDSRNPYFVSPVGASQHEIAYSFRNDIGNTRTSGQVENIGASIGAEADIGSRWRASGYIAYARDASENHTSNQINSLFLSEALGRSPDDPDTAYDPARDGYFNPFGVGDNPRESLSELAKLGARLII
ncbi:MAG: TonB-dependent receptor, partial [Sphingomonas taxi]